MNIKDIPGYLIMWAIAGTFTATALFAAQGKGNGEVTTSEYLGVVLLWPLFVIKYVCIGAYMVVSAGLGALV